MLEEENIEAPVEVIEKEEPVKVPSVRDSLAAAVEESKAKQTDEKPARAVKEAKLPKETKTDIQVKTKVFKDAPREAEVKTDLPAIKVPQSFGGDKKALWDSMPRNVQEFWAKREDEFHRELTKQDEERTFGRSVKELATPYIPLIKAEGGDIVKGFQSYLNTAYILRTKSPQEKGQLLMQLAREFGADLRGVQAQNPVNPQLHQLQQELAGLKGSIEQEKALKKQQEDAALQTQVEAFAADPKNIHFETVKADMAALLRGNVAKDLQDAYDRAVYANPQTRSTLLAQKDSEEKQVADKKAKAEAAKKAGSSLRGGPGPSALRNGNIPQPDLRKALVSAFAEHRGEA
jgi:hypothetical protein